MPKPLIRLVPILFTLPLAAAAQRPPPHERPEPPPHVMKKIMRDAGLSGAQIKQVESLHFEAERERVDIHHELAKARLELQRLLSADAPDDSAVFAQVDKIGALDTRLKKNRIGLLLKVRRLMTPEQWEKMQMARAAFRMRRGHPHAVPVPPMPPPPPPPP